MELDVHSAAFPDVDISEHYQIVSFAELTAHSIYLFIFFRYMERKILPLLS